MPLRPAAARLSLLTLALGFLFPLLAPVETSAEERIVHSSAHGDYRHPHAAAANDNERAGHPQSVAWYAKFSQTKHHSYGWVGGGALFHKSEAPRSNEGTWGRDYHLFSMHKVWLGWSHGRRYQGGGGAYKTDGPKLHLHKE
jgi:hypothetical protein